MNVNIYLSNERGGMESENQMVSRKISFVCGVLLDEEKVHLQNANFQSSTRMVS